MNALVFDDTGHEQDEPRLDILMRALQAVRIECAAWDGRPPASPAGLLVLAHRTDLSPAHRTTLEAAAAGGAQVVLYSGGRVGYSDQARGRGWLTELEWQVLQRVVTGLSAGADLAAFRRALQAGRHRDLVAALAILCRCVIIQSDSQHIQDRQALWKTSTTRWLPILEGYTRDQAVRAFGAVDLAALERSLPNVGALVSWLWPRSSASPSPRPDFGAVLQEVLTHCAVRA
jgi:hypothetical protein